MPTQFPKTPSSDRLNGLYSSGLALPAQPKAFIAIPQARWRAHAGPSWAPSIDTIIQLNSQRAGALPAQFDLIHLGCGSGINTVRMTGTIIGVDSDPELIELAENAPILAGDALERLADVKAPNRLHRPFRPGSRFLTSELDQTGLPDHCARCVIVEAPMLRGPIRAVLTEASRLVQPGGSVIVLRAFCPQTGEEAIDAPLRWITQNLGGEPEQPAQPEGKLGSLESSTKFLKPDLASYEKASLHTLYAQLEREPGLIKWRESALSPLNTGWHYVRKAWGRPARRRLVRWHMDVQAMEIGQ